MIPKSQMFKKTDLSYPLHWDTDYKHGMGTRLTRDFFSRPTLEVAPDLIGKTLVFNGIAGIILETEAYIAKDDPACHAARGKTPRTAIMFGPPGHAYVYFIYGMYYCLNLITEPEGSAAGVLLRSLYIKKKMIDSSDDSSDSIQQYPILLDGPGKICKYLGITTVHKGIDIVESPNFYVLDEGIKTEGLIKATPRIGLRVGVEKPWRFVVDGNLLSV